MCPRALCPKNRATQTCSRRTNIGPRSSGLVGPRSLLGFVLVLFLATAFPGCGRPRASAPRRAITVGKAHKNRACERNPRDGVQHADRLQVLSPCAAFQGVLIDAPVKYRPDGDVVFDVKPDPGYANMLNAQNRSEGGLHIEIVPRDQPGCTPGQPIHINNLPNLGTCSGRDLAAPALGAHVRIIGPWVLDRNHNFYEIHPAWSIKPVRRSTR